MEIADLRHDHFSSRIGDTFQLDLDGGTTIDLELTAASEPPEARADHAHYVEWTGPSEFPLEQGIRRLRHPDLGELELFLVPVNQVAAGFVYEAVFTRLDD